MSVVEHSRTASNVTNDLVSVTVALYMIRVRPNRSALFLPPESLEICMAEKRDHVRSFIRRMMLNKYWIVRWVGRVTRVAHRFYQKLEDRIDPLERMIKALNHQRSLLVFHAPHKSPQSEFRDLLRSQLVKHMFWLLIDGAITAVAISFFWLLVPIPGPNVFFYYPALRMLSHYSAMCGARKALNKDIEFTARPEIERLEASLRAGHKADSGCARAGINVNGLEAYLDRMA